MTAEMRIQILKDNQHIYCLIIRLLLKGNKIHINVNRFRLFNTDWASGELQTPEHLPNVLETPIQMSGPHRVAGWSLFYIIYIYLRILMAQQLSLCFVRA